MAGVVLFLCAMFVCCGSSLVSKNVAERRDLMDIGWRIPLGGGELFYSAQRAITVSVLAGVFFGVALAGLGLGLQAEHRAAPYGAAAVAVTGLLFWATHAAFAVQPLRSAWLTILASALALCFAALSALAAGAVREMRRDPPPPGHEVLPADYKVPYSHLHADPPEVRLARELEERRRRLAVQQKELEALEEKVRLKRGGPPGA